MVPIKSTSPISALRPGLAKKATTICLYSTTMTSVHSTRNTSIRTRKIRGEDSLLSSISIAEREEGLDGISWVIRCEEPLSGSNMAQRRRENRSDRPLSRWKGGTRGLKPDLDWGVFRGRSTPGADIRGFA